MIYDLKDEKEFKKWVKKISGYSEVNNYFEILKERIKVVK